MNIVKTIEGLTIQRIVIIAAILALLILLWSNRALIAAKLSFGENG